MGHVTDPVASPTSQAIEFIPTLCQLFAIARFPAKSRHPEVVGLEKIPVPLRVPKAIRVVVCVLDAAAHHRAALCAYETSSTSAQQIAIRNSLGSESSAVWISQSDKASSTSTSTERSPVAAVAA
jgi:hypothetical protein